MDRAARPRTTQPIGTTKEGVDLVGTTGAQIGLLAFAVAVVAGLLAGNSATVILLRAIVALLVGAGVGQAAAWTAKTVLRDYLQRRKLLIDQEHKAAVQAILTPGDVSDEVEEHETGAQDEGAVA